jgi:uncharacterized membrane-anchored protein
LLPPGWLHGIPGRVITAVHAELIPMPPQPPSAEELAQWFGGFTPVASGVGNGAGQVYTDYKIHEDGCSRFVVLDDHLTVRQAGRMFQRMFEIEVYRMMALLALPIARRQSPRVLAIEKSLAELTDRMAREAGDDEALLAELTRLAGEVESGLSASQFRFGACQAYHELVMRRIHELRETRLHGFQMIEEFMARRFEPAVATCLSLSQRLQGISERIARACALLSTRVDIARERQNQALLASMDKRARLQLRLQETVEGLSVAAIVYYAVGLVGYLAKGAKAAGLSLNPDLVAGLAIPALVPLVFLTIRKARKHLAGDSGH